MKTAAILLVALGLTAGAGAAAAAASHLSDTSYLKANRCRGLAEGLGSGDIAGLDALIKTEGRSRTDGVYTMGQEALNRGRKDASRADSRERLSAELNGPCAAYAGGATAGASAGKTDASTH